MNAKITTHRDGAKTWHTILANGLHSITLYSGKNANRSHDLQDSVSRAMEWVIGADARRQEFITGTANNVPEVRQEWVCGLVGHNGQFFGIQSFGVNGANKAADFAEAVNAVLRYDSGERGPSPLHPPGWPPVDPEEPEPAPTAPGVQTNSDDPF